MYFPCTCNHAVQKHSIWHQRGIAILGPHELASLLQVGVHPDEGLGVKARVAGLVVVDDLTRNSLSNR